ncbi:MAG: hypothetical protein JKY61_12560 [Planctomycetes bacterium]|nr:hypothetical protein [Planctomycetota bacterium]
MTGISGTGPAPAVPSTNVPISIAKMQQDHAKVEGQMANKLITAAAEVQLTGKGGRVNVLA